MVEQDRFTIIVQWMTNICHPNGADIVHLDSAQFIIWFNKSKSQSRLLGSLYRNLWCARTTNCNLWLAGLVSSIDIDLNPYFTIADKTSLRYIRRMINLLSSLLINKGKTLICRDIYKEEITLYRICALSIFDYCQCKCVDYEVYKNNKQIMDVFNETYE